MVDRLIPDLTTRNIRNAGDSFRRLQQEIRGWDVVIWEDDFLGDAIDTRYPAVATGVDGSFDASATGISGVATLDVGDGATSGDDEYGGQPLGNLEWQGDLNAFTVARIKISDITTVKVEFGFTDALTDAGAVNDLATPTVTATDCAVWCLDTDDTATWQAVSANAGTAGKSENSSIVAPVNDTYQYLGVFLEGDNVIFKQWDASGAKVGEDIVLDSGIEGGTAVAPWLFVQNRAATIDRVVTIDYVMTGQRRS